MQVWCRIKGGNNASIQIETLLLIIIINMKLNIKTLTIAAAAVLPLSGCGFGDYDIEYPTKRVLFTYQTYNYQVVVGEGLRLKVGFVFAGLPENDRDRVVKYAVDPSLVTDEDQMPLPEGYYTFDNPSEIVIPKGALKAYMPVRLDSAAFVNDPKALTGEYILPVRITEADADEISPGKGYTMISLSYQGRQYGNYTYKGKATGSNGEIREYTNQPTATNSIRQLQTVAADKFRVYADQNGTSDPAKGKYSMIVTVPVKGGGSVALEPDTEYLPDTPVTQNGECTYDESSKTFVLRYRYTDADGVEWTCEDTMVFRNRVRNDQGDGRVLYEWRGF